MQIALLSDIHANTEALTAIEPWLDEVDQIVVLGDVVGYGADPEACLNWVIKRNSQCLMGNHDAACSGVLSLDWFNHHARKALLWTRRHLSSSALSYLERLPHRVNRLGALWVHGSPDLPLKEYITHRSIARRMFVSHDFSICFFGHTHLAEAYVLKGTDVTHLKLAGGGEVILEKRKRYLINCGSTGQPRDGNPQASFGLLDTSRMVIRVVRVDYDRERAARKILEAGLPDVLAYRLFEGR